MCRWQCVSQVLELVSVSAVCVCVCLRARGCVCVACQMCGRVCKCVNCVSVCAMNRGVADSTPIEGGGDLGVGGGGLRTDISRAYTKQNHVCVNEGYSE